MPAYEHLYEFLKNGSSRDADVDGSTPVVFKYTVPTGDTLELARLMVYIEDSGNDAVDTDKYGALNALGTGVSLGIFDGDDVQTLDLTGGFPIKTAGAYKALMFDVSPEGGQGNVKANGFRFTFSRAGEPLFLPEGYSIRATINDDLQGLDKHWFMIQGIVH